MVNSKIDNTINYIEMKKIRPQDSSFDAQIYSYEINDIPILIAVGNVDNTFIDKGVYYITIYLVHDSEIVSQIGVFEFLSDEYPNLLDEENDIDLEKLDEPLLYSFINDDYLRKYKTIIEEEEEEEEEEGTEKKVPEEEEEENVLTEPQETVYEDLTNKEIKSYIDEGDISETELDIDGDNWFQNFMKSKKYGIVDNEGGGDCLFAVIRDAFKNIGKKVSIAKMRDILSTNLDEKTYLQYKELYDNFKSEESSIINESKEYVNKFKLLKKAYAEEENSDVKKTQRKQLLEIKAKNDKLKENLNFTRENLEDVAIMKDVNNMEDFRKKIKTCEFWADIWAISTLEKILKIKLVIFSSLNYDNNDSDNVLQCGLENVSSDTFEPKYYILADHTGNHYKLITYNDKSIFLYKDIPKNIKKLIVTKCMETNNGIYNLIPEFKKYKEDLKKDIEPNLDVVVSDKEIVIHPDEKSLYDSDEGTIFQFYSKSTNKPLPGKGSGETIKPEYLKKYRALSKIKDWRKKLSNLYNSPFTLDGYNWNSVEHYYQANKFKRNNNEFYKKFTVESDTELSKDSAMAKGAGGKTGKYKKIQIRPKNIESDFDFFEAGNPEKVMENAMRAKFTQNEDLKQLLIETKDAKLNHFERGSPPVTFFNLMRVRSELNN